MVRRLGIAALPLLAAGAVLALVLGYTHRSQSPGSSSPATAAVAAPPKPRAKHRHRVLPRPPAQIRGATAEHTAIPILMYHVIGTIQPGQPYPELWVRPAAFAAQMKALERAGYWAITLRQAWRAWTRGGALPRRPVVVSFDDGYRGDYTHARPVLRRLGWPGLLNLALSNVRRGDLPASEVRALIRSGWELASHTVHHLDLTTTTPAQTRYELVASRQQIRKKFGVRAQFFCYPLGHYNASVEAAVHAAGYLAATTEDEGYATAAAPYALRRVRVYATDTPATLLARLSSERPA
jgi:peptidoglycan/xylan/chitin deacetylase (PgdA/CDA1 family)